MLDLGRDVAPETIVETALRENIRVIGLSALMTTNLKSMEETIALARSTEGLEDCVFLVGGAVLTAEYAEKIGADYYCRDAKESVDAAKQIFG